MKLLGFLTKEVIENVAHWIRVMILSTGIVVVAWMILQSFSGSPRQPLQKICVFGGFDTSGSARDYLLGPGTVATQRLVARLEPSWDYLMLWRVDHDTVRFWGPDVPDSQETLPRAFVAELRDPARSEGTYPAIFWERVAEESDRFQDRVIICFWWDGDNDDPRPQSVARMKAAIKRLAKNPRVVAVGIFGVSRKNLDRLDREFAEVGQDRLRIYRSNGIDLDWLANRIDAARH